MSPKKTVEGALCGICSGVVIGAITGIGIFGQQVIPTIITMFIFWPVILSQLWGIVKQSQLDDRVMIIAANTIARSGGGYPDASKYYG